jgi:hypothetical protein
MWRRVALARPRRSVTRAGGIDHFTEAGSESGALLLKRHERKCGSARNVEKPVYVCVVPHAYPKLCPIVHNRRR